MAHTFSCGCGTLAWQLATEAGGPRLRCYCADCQAYAVALGADDMLDAAGGTELFQTLPSAVTFTKGVEHLKALRLTPKGLMRWYAGCCKTPIANTLVHTRLPFVGMVVPVGSDRLGPLGACVMTKRAKSPVREHGFARTGFSLLARGIGARLRGDTSGAPFFDRGKPVLRAAVLSEGSAP